MGSVTDEGALGPQAKVGLALTGAAAALAIVGSWLPWISSEVGLIDKTFTANGFAAGEEGWWTAGLGVMLLLVVVLYRPLVDRRVALGVIAIGASLACTVITLTDYQETQQRGVPGTRDALIESAREAFQRENPGATFDADEAAQLIGFRGGPGTGIWTLFFASGLGIFGGILLIGGASLQTPTVGPPSNEQEAEIDTKLCPRCAETVKTAALVCRFCGHEFGENNG